MKKIVITGAAGAVGKKVYPLLKKKFDVVMSDIVRPEISNPDDQDFEFVHADIRNLDELREAFRGAHGVVHLAAVGAEDEWSKILDISIDGTFKAYEAARLEGVKNFVYTSSVHAIGFYPRSQKIGINEYVRPDSRYGISKCFGESVGSLYADKYGMRVMCVRIGNVTHDSPINERELSIWVSERDLAQLFAIGLEREDYHYEIVYGESGNTRSWWDNSSAEKLGYKPQDNAEDYAAELLANGPIEDPASLSAKYQGGMFVEFE